MNYISIFPCSFGGLKGKIKRFMYEKYPVAWKNIHKNIFFYFKYIYHWFENKIAVPVGLRDIEGQRVYSRAGPVTLEMNSSSKIKNLCVIKNYYFYRF